MPHGQYVFSQLMDHMPLTTFRRCVVRYNGERKVKHFSCLDQLRCLAFAQLTWRESLRDIEACLNAQASKLYRLGFRAPHIARNTMMDRGYLDFERLARLDNAGSFFVTRAKSNTQVRRRYSRPIDRSTGLVCDQTVVLTGYYTRKGFDSPLRRVKFNDPETGKTLVFLSNNFALPAMTIAKLYKYRWRVELFFKWIKQHLRIKAFFGETENAVKTQIWSAVCVYVLVAIVKKRLAIKASLYEMLQILSLTPHSLISCGPFPGFAPGQDGAEARGVFLQPMTSRLRCRRPLHSARKG